MFTLPKKKTASQMSRLWARQKRAERAGIFNLHGTPIRPNGAKLTARGFQVLSAEVSK